MMLTRIGSGKVVKIMFILSIYLSLVMLNAPEIRGKLTWLGFDFSKLYRSSVPIEISMKTFLS